MLTNLWTYYILCIESDDFINDFKTHFDKILIVPEDYINSTIELLINRYRDDPRYTPIIIKKAINKAAKYTIDLIYQKFLNPFLITTKHGRVMHKLRAQLIKQQNIQ